MKKVSFFIYSLLFWVSCTNSNTTGSTANISSTPIEDNSKSLPKGVAQSFLEYVSKGKYEEAKAFGTKNTVMLLDFSSKMMEKMDKNVNKTFDFKIVRESIKDNHALVYFYDGRTKKEESMDLIKTNNTWKVDLRIK